MRKEPVASTSGMSSKASTPKKVGQPVRRQRRERSVKRKVSTVISGPSTRKRQMSRRESLIDDNTTNSDNSENNTLFNEINWEENLEVDTTSLLDEFAPRLPATSVAAASPSSESQGSLRVTEVEVKQIMPEKPTNASPERQDELKFSVGGEIHVMDYTTDTWFTATVLEVDWDEEEVLVHYGDTTKSDEWVSMNSRRLSEVKPKAEPSASSSTYEITVRPIKSPKIKEEPVDDKPLFGDNKVLRSPVSSRVRKTPRSFHKRQGRGWKAEIGSQSKQISSKRGKFEVGEKVLAKWSDHRMQKFPAVIKSVLGNGKYDVLFYDGFEKTITGGDIFKTTEEEVAKYQQSNPSEADSFVDMDIGSKEERRQRKKKTFDDYLFAKDLFKSRRRSELQSGDGSRTTPTAGRKQSTEKDADDTPPKSSRNKKMVQTLSATKKRMKRKDGRCSFQLEDVGKVSDSEQLADTPAFEKLSFDEPTLALGDSPEQTLSAETSISMDESGSETHVVKKIPVCQLSEGGERWIGDIPLDKYPIKLTGHDGTPRKSIIIPDKKLPQGWTKHAVMLKPGGSWEPFLISPDGFKLNNRDDLKSYCRDVLMSEPAESIDFALYFRALPELAHKQNEMPCKGKYRKWERKRGRRRKLLMPSTSGSPLPLPEIPHQVGRVRTLLPKYRTTSPVTSAQPSSPAPSTSAESEMWRCPKQGCDKKFRKENLLQMHIKHYHVEFKALVGSAPNVVDLACARSESANSDWNLDQVKQVHGSIKRIMPKTPSHGGSYGERADTEQQIVGHQALPSQLSLSSQGPSFSRSDMSGLSYEDSLLSKRQSLALEEKKTTIKTILPLRQPLQDSSKLGMESDELESDDEIGDSQKMASGSRMFKTGRPKKPRLEPKFSNLSAPMDDIGMRDHGYPMYQSSKIGKKKQLPVIDKLQVATDSNDSYTEEEKPSPSADTTEELINVERLRSEEVINCTCGFKEEDGLMIQCDICLCWQHGACAGIDKESDVPDKYVCHICRNPTRVHSSRKYSFARQYLTQGKLPSLNLRPDKEGIRKQRENVLKKCYDLSASLHQVMNVERSVRVKINIAQQPDHPKLYLWAKNWNEPSTSTKTDDLEIKKETEGPSNETTECDDKPTAPVPEAPIDLDECRMNLMDHVEHYQQLMEARLTSLQAQVAALESLDPDLASEETSDRYPVTKQTVHMLIRDLKNLRKYAAIS